MCTATSANSDACVMASFELYKWWYDCTVGLVTIETCFSGMMRLQVAPVVRIHVES